jgi:hypothetical protein
MTKLLTRLGFVAKTAVCKTSIGPSGNEGCLRGDEKLHNDNN